MAEEIARPGSALLACSTARSPFGQQRRSSLNQLCQRILDNRLICRRYYAIHIRGTGEKYRPMSLDYETLAERFNQCVASIGWNRAAEQPPTSDWPSVSLHDLSLEVRSWAVGNQQKVIMCAQRPPSA